jgi:murein DD-endopeptidase MepM/ murein hydrolase activator NlpD
MRFRTNHDPLLFLLAIGVMILAACRPAAGNVPDTTPGGILVTAEATSAVRPTITTTASRPATLLPSLTATALPPPTATTRPTSTPTASFTPSPTVAVKPSPTVDITATVAVLEANDPVDRTCPDPPPAKPDYRHFYLDARRWPAPDAEPEKHLWLDKPLPGGGRLLYTDWLPYGYDAGGRYLLHNGIDAAEPLGTPVLAAADGTVIVAGEDAWRLFGWRCDWYGHLVVIELDQRWRTQPVYVVYGHVLNMTVRPGERVNRGQQVAEVGFGGAARLPHLHFEVRVGSNEFGATRNPFLWLQPPATRGLIAGRLVDPEGRPWQGVTVTAVGRSEGTESQTSWTYLGDPEDLINPDESLAENFVLADLKPGEYELYVELQGTVYKLPVSVQGGQLMSVEIVTEPFKTPTPGPPAEPTPEIAETAVTPDS